MAGAALPTAATHTGPVPRPPASARATQRRPSTRSRPRRSSVSSSSRRGSRASLVSAPANDLQLTGALAPRQLGRIRAYELQPLEVLGRHIPGDVHTGETRRVELLDARILVLAGGDQVIQILVDQPVGADQALDLGDAAPAPHELTRGRHVDAVDVGEAYRRSGGGEVHLGSASLAGQLDDLRRGRAAP